MVGVFKYKSTDFTGLGDEAGTNIHVKDQGDDIVEFQSYVGELPSFYNLSPMAGSFWVNYQLPLLTEGGDPLAAHAFAIRAVWSGQASQASFFGGDLGDVLEGGSGDDGLSGKGGEDTLTGGAGDDTFSGTAAELNGDTITDFAVGDKIEISGGDFSAATFSDGVLAFGGNQLTLTGASGTITATYEPPMDIIEAGTTSITLDAPSVPAPGTPGLGSMSVTGSSNSDTGDTTPTFTGTGIDGNTVTLFSDANNNGSVDTGEELGTDTVTGGTWSITSSTLAEGDYSIRAVQTDNAGVTSAASTGLSLKVDTTAPTVNAAPATGVPVALDASIAVKFDEPVLLASTGTVTLYDETNDTAVLTFDVSQAQDGTVTLGDTSTATLVDDTLTIDPHDDLASKTHYRVDISAGAMTDAAGNSIAAVGDGTYEFTTIDPDALYTTGTGFVTIYGTNILNGNAVQSGSGDTIIVTDHAHLVNAVIDGGAGDGTNTLVLAGTTGADLTSASSVANVSVLEVSGAGAFKVSMNEAKGWDVFDTFKGNGSATLGVTSDGPLDATGKTFTNIDTLDVNTGFHALTVNAAVLSQLSAISGNGGEGDLASAEKSFDLSGLAVTYFDRVQSTFNGDATITIGANIAVGGFEAVEGHANTLRTTHTELDLSNVRLNNIGVITTTNTTGTEITGAGESSENIVGGVGADTLTGGVGVDTLTGGAGDDIFVDVHRDTITDFAEGDTIRVTDLGHKAIHVASVAPTTDLDAATHLSFDNGLLKIDGNMDGDFDDTGYREGDLSVTLTGVSGGTFSVTNEAGYSDITWTAPSTGGGGGGGGGGTTPPTDPTPVTPPPGTGGGGGGGGGADTPATPSQPSTRNEDGATVTRTTETGPGGRSQEVTDIQPVAADRDEDPDTPNGALADVTLAEDDGGGDGDNAPALRAGLPAGVGMRSEGSSTRLSREDALADLIARIEQKTEDGSQPREEMTGTGQSFLNTIPEDSQLIVKTVTPTVADDARPGGPIVITGADTPGRQEALVIDVSNLPRGTVLQLDDVDFAAIVGDVRVIGGSGSNVVTGDDSAQIIVLGADDDILHGGGGDDEIGSEGGDDQLFGDAGNDTVFGGSGDDSVSGGSGDDALRGDEGTDTVVYGGALENFRFYRDGDDLVVVDTTGAEGRDTLETIELGSFDGQQVDLDFTQADPWMVMAIASIYHGVLDRSADIGGLNFWLDYAGQHGIGRVAEAFTFTPEFIETLGANLSDDQFAENVYQHVLGRDSDAEGKAWWLDRLAEGADRGDMIVGFTVSDEHYAMITTDDGVWLV